MATRLPRDPDPFRDHYRPFNEDELKFKHELKAGAEKLLHLIQQAEFNQRVNHTPEAFDLARQRLQEVVFWSVYAVSGD